MDLVAEMLLLNLRRARGATRRRDRTASSHGASADPAAARRSNVDRGHGGSDPEPRLGLPAMACARRSRDYDLFHIIDHSYAHLATRLPAGRSVVSCHDLDAFRGVLPGTRRGVARRTGAGPAAAGGNALGAEDPVRERRHAQRAGVGGVDTRRTRAGRATRRASGVQPPIRACRGSRRGLAPRPADGDRVELLHVGSTIPRKRIDVLLHVVAALRWTRSGLRLIRSGGPFTTSQRRLAGSLGLDGHVAVLPFRHATRAVRDLSTRGAAAPDIGSRGVWPAGRRGHGLRYAGRGQRPASASRSRRPVVHLLPRRRDGRWTAAAARRCSMNASNDPERWRGDAVEGIDWARRFDWQVTPGPRWTSIESCLECAPGHGAAMPRRPDR